MVNKHQQIYLIENDHKLKEYCEEKGFVPNDIPLKNFIEIAEDIGWVMTSKEFEMHHNTRTLPDYYYIRITDM